MKTCAFLAAVFALPMALGMSAEERAEPQLPDIKQIFEEECALKILSACPEAVDAAQPYLDGTKTGFDLETIIEIGQNVADKQECRDAIPPCAGKVVEKSLAKLLGSDEPAKPTTTPAQG